MNKVFFQAAFLAVLSIAIPAQAQTTNETTDTAATAPVTAPVVVTPPVISASPSAPHETPLAIGLREGLPLRVRQEQAFDANGDNRLEPDEIKAFLKSVYKDTANGPVKNTSDILYQFDKNKDGYIDRSEASAFSQYAI